MKKFDRFCIWFIIFSTVMIGAGVIAGACNRDDGPVKNTYGFMNHEGITMDKGGVLDILYDTELDLFYIEYDDADAFDYENFYYTRGTAYLDYIKVYIPESEFSEFLDNYRNMSNEEFEDTYDMLPVAGLGEYNIFYQINCNER